MRKVKFSHIVREIRFVRKVILFGEHGVFQYVRTWDGGLPPEIWQKYFHGPPYPTEQQWEDIEFFNDAS
jgi:hypothetical protein